MKMELELVESLCGFQKTITTLDQRQLVITALPGEIFKPGDIKCVLNEGMPINGHPHDKGKLIIQFNVKFPKVISPDVIVRLENCLPPRYVHILQAATAVTACFLQT